MTEEPTAKCPPPSRPTQQGLGPPFSRPPHLQPSAPAGKCSAWATGESTLTSAQLTPFPYRYSVGEKKFGDSFPVSSTFETQLKSKGRKCQRQVQADLTVLS